MTEVVFWDNTNTPYRKQVFDWLYCPIEPFQIKAVLFPPFVHHIPAAAQRGCSDALICHSGQRRGQHTRTSLPVSSPCLQPLLYTALLLIPLPGFLQIPSVCLSGSRSAAFPDPENRRNWERERGGTGVTLPEHGSRIRGKRANTIERIEGGSHDG